VAGEITFDGVSEGGGRVFYDQGGDLFVYDTATGVTTPAVGGGEISVVNVSADGSHVYFYSASVLASGGQAGEPNLYVWNGAGIKFVAMVAAQDLSGLTRWSQAITTRGRGSDPSRTTPDGAVFVFQAHEVVGFSYGSGGHSEIYRYEAGSG